MRSLRPIALFLAVAWTAPSGNAEWDPRFFLSGIQGEVRAVAVSGNAVYAGGLFTSADNSAVTNIAKWNGTNWSALGGGLNGPVNAIAIHGSNVFAGGTFTAAGGVPASRVARWNGTNWVSLGSGIAGAGVNALAVTPGGALYAAGDFSAAGGATAANIARWDGTNWSALAGGLSNGDFAAWVWALASRGEELFAGGFFTEAGGVSVSCLAHWNGASWFDVGGGVDDRDYLPQVAALVVDGGDLYVGGAFTLAGNLNAAHIAKWTGSSWSALGSGLGRYFGDVPVSCLAVSGAALVVGGRFVSAGGVSVTNLAVWDGFNWSDLGGPATGKIKTLAANGTNLFLGGSYALSNALTSLAFARWNGGAWSNVSGGGGLGVFGQVEALALNGNGIYAGGDFTSAGSARATNLARWNGSSWAAVGDGVGGPVLALCSVSNELFVGGQFASAGGLSAANIAHWNGTNYSSLGNGVNGAVHALIAHAGEIYAAGAFSSAGSITASNIARWDGARWLGPGGGVNGTIYAMAASGANLYVGGKFTSAGGVSATNLARWNGQTWSALGNGISGVANPIARIRPPPVSALAVVGDALYVGGDFAMAGNVLATNIAKWDGTNWSAVGGGVRGIPSLTPPPAVAAFTVHDGKLYIAGAFTHAGGISANNIARWNGTDWATFGAGLGLGVSTPASVSALTINEAGVFVGGHFNFAGGRPASGFSIRRFDPTLRITRVGEALQISWPAGADAILEASESLFPALWREVTNAPTTIEDRLNLLIPPTGRSQFYRLLER